MPKNNSKARKAQRKAKADSQSSQLPSLMGISSHCGLPLWEHELLCVEIMKDC